MRTLSLFFICFLICSLALAEKTVTCEKYSESQVICTTSHTDIIPLDVYEKMVQIREKRATEAQADFVKANQVLTDFKADVAITSLNKEENP